jgi:hypothetical protein
MITNQEIEVSLCYDEPIRYEIQLHSEATNVDFTKQNSKSKIMDAFILESASSILQSRGLPSLEEILTQHYPESQL